MSAIKSPLRHRREGLTLPVAREQRKLAAILAADVVRLLSRDEARRECTLARLQVF